MKYELSFAESLQEPELALVQAYWKIEDGEFVHKALPLAQAHEMTVSQLTALARASVECKISFGNCIGCGDELLVVIKSKTAFQGCVGDFSRQRCPDCLRAFEKRQLFEQRLATEQPGSALGYNAVELKPWQNLPVDELEVLKCIAQFKIKERIYQHLFREGSRFDRTTVWEVFNRLERKRLIVIKRNHTRGIDGFTYLPELDKVLLGFADVTVVPPVDFLNLKLNKNPAARTKHHADYAGVFTVESEVVLKKGSRYIYGAWVNEQSVINFQITPLANLHQYPNQGFAGQEPVIIKEILERLLPQHEVTE
jgi:hypothetical protein